MIDIPHIRGLVEAANYEGLVEVEIFSEANWWRKGVNVTLATCADRLQTLC